MGKVERIELAPAVEPGGDGVENGRIARALLERILAGKTKAEVRKMEDEYDRKS